MHEIKQGNCLEILKTFQSNSIDSLVTDPPAGISFMGKDWDSDKGGREEWMHWLSEVMREVHRVLKPGGHVLDPFAGSGSTGVAAKQEGFRFSGIEQNAEYVDIARKRLENTIPTQRELDLKSMTRVV